MFIRILHLCFGPGQVELHKLTCVGSCTWSVPPNWQVTTCNLSEHENQYKCRTLMLMANIYPSTYSPIYVHLDSPFCTFPYLCTSGPAFVAKIWQTMGTPAINAEASQSRRRPTPKAIFFWRVLARRRATLREFSAIFLSFNIFQKWRFWRTHVWHMNNNCRNLMKGWVDIRNSSQTLISFTKF